MRVCQFRHDGKWTSIVAAAQRPLDAEDLHIHSTDTKLPVKRSTSGSLHPNPSCLVRKDQRSYIVISWY